MGFWISVCIILAVSVAATSKSASADGSADLFDFRDAIAEVADRGVPARDNEVICVEPFKYGGIDGQNLTFLGEKGKGGDLVVISGFQISNLRTDLWAGGPLLDDDFRTKPTPDWGWIFDRNNDGNMDWLAFLNGPVIVVPKEGFQEGFPNLLVAGSNIELSQVAILKEHARIVYNHVIDTDFDGDPDAVMIKPTSDLNGWWEGEMLILDESGECLWQSDYKPSSVQDCAFNAAAGGFKTQGAELTRTGRINKNFQFKFFNSVKSTILKCRFDNLGIVNKP